MPVGNAHASEPELQEGNTAIILGRQDSHVTVLSAFLHFSTELLFAIRKGTVCYLTKSNVYTSIYTCVFMDIDDKLLL